MRALILVAALTLAGCGAAPEKKAAAPPPPPPAVDNTFMLLPLHQTSARVVPDHLLGNKALPGGTLGEYENAGLKYKLFIVQTPSEQDAAILLLDVKLTLQSAEYIAYMGGYFGTDQGAPLYVFAKQKYLAGVAGLTKNQADDIARELAVRLH